MPNMTELDPDAAAATFITRDEVQERGTIEVTVAKQNEFEENRLNPEKVNVVVLEKRGDEVVMRLLPVQRWQANQMAKARGTRSIAALAGLVLRLTTSPLPGGKWKGTSVLNINIPETNK